MFLSPLSVMPDLPATFAALCGLALALGARHGLDADHLATIDGLARLNAAARPRLARAAGTLFSLGHGAVVMGIALAAATLARQWQAPPWLEAIGQATSVACLLGLGVMNLQAVARARPSDVVAPRGLKGRLLARVVAAQRPATVAGVGALFALSFDTLSLAALFALTAAHLGGVGYVVLAALSFTFGMVAVDGLNGWWISRVIARADRTAARASRAMSMAVAASSIGVAALAALRLAAPDLDAFLEARGVLVSAAVFAAVAAAMLIGRAGRPPH
jgi:high-affinity nickel-transport protein